jgi:hypothetical protein
VGLNLSKSVHHSKRVFFSIQFVKHVKGQWRRDESDCRVEEGGDTKASRGDHFLDVEFKSVYSEIQDTQVDVLHQDV